MPRQQPPITKPPQPETVTVPKSNWSGESITVTIDRANLVWEHYDYTFWLVFKPYDEDLRGILGDGQYEIHGDSWDFPLGTVRDARTRPTDKPQFEATDEEGLESGCEREAGDPVVAAIQLLCNIL